MSHCKIQYELDPGRLVSLSHRAVGSPFILSPMSCCTLLLFVASMQCSEFVVVVVVVVVDTEMLLPLVLGGAIWKRR